MQAWAVTPNIVVLRMGIFDNMPNKNQTLPFRFCYLPFARRFIGLERLLGHPPP